MLTIKGTFGAQFILGIPNNNVRKQYYQYLLEMYQDEQSMNTEELKTKFTYMAFEGKWRDAMQYMADSYAKISSVRDSIEGSATYKVSSWPISASVIITLQPQS